MRTFRPRRGLVATAVMLAAAVLLPAVPSGAVNIGHPSVVSEDPSGFTPNITNGRVNAMMVMNGMVYVGGTFSTVQNAGSSTNITRNNILAYNATTGIVSTTFRPILNGAVEALAPGPNGSVYIGGNFGSANGSTTYRRLVRVNATTGATVTSFVTNPNRMVTDLVMRNGQLYASGEFVRIGGTDRSGLARLDPNTGVADPALNVPFTDPWISPREGIVSRMRVWRIDVTPDGSKLIAGGNFRQVGGQATPAGRDPERESEPRHGQLVELDLLPVHGPEQPGPPHEQLVLGDLPALPSGHRHLARRLLRRHREHRCEPTRPCLV